MRGVTDLTELNNLFMDYTGGTAHVDIKLSRLSSFLNSLAPDETDLKKELERLELAYAIGHRINCYLSPNDDEDYLLFNRQFVARHPDFSAAPIEELIGRLKDLKAEKELRDLPNAHTREKNKEELRALYIGIK